MKACTNCGAEMADVYCASCGEKQPNPHDLTLRHFAHETVHELVHLDSKLFRTLRELVMKPGRLTAEYFAGRKKRYIAPLRLFLTLFAVTFIAYSAFEPVAIYSIKGLIRTDPKQQLKGALERAAKKKNVTYEELVERIEHRWQKTMSVVSMLNIISMALLLKLLYLRRHLVEHFVFGTHYMSFSYVLSLLIWPIQMLMGIRQAWPNFLLAAATAIVSCVYIYLAMRRVYGQSVGITTAKAIAAWATTFATSMFLFAASLIGALIYVLRG